MRNSKLKKPRFELQDLIRENVTKMKPYSSARDEYKNSDLEITFLNANENPFENGINRYPDPQQEKLKNLLSAMNKVEISNILLGNGSDEILDLLFRAFCEPRKDNIIMLPPTYGMYEVLADLNDVEVKKANLTDNFQPSLDLIFQLINENSKIIFLCSPNNPTGNTFSKPLIQEILERFNGLVVIDEAYIDFSLKKSWLTCFEEFPNLVIVRTLSKAYAMAGIRLGICYASKEIIMVLNKIKAPYNVNELTQQKALKNLEDSGKLKNEIEQIKSERDKLQQKLKKLNFIEKVFPSEANFLLVRVDDANKRYQQLIDEGIVVRNRTNEPLCENTLRITVGTPEENEKLLGKIKKL